jgi:ribosomal-protein-alanine N-acetyltransferase
LPDYVRRMCREDADRVLKIDREAFPTEWPPTNFGRELDNRLAYYIVACRVEAGSIPALIKETRKPDPPERGFVGLISRVRKLFGNNGLPDEEPSARDDEDITGFAGFWVMVDEAHITSIATREAYRRQGIGELMLQSIIDLAAVKKARIVTLEVRVSNTVAQSLYTRYGFSQVGLRRGYYTDNREDAIVMSTDSIHSAAFRAHVRELKRTYHAKWGTDRYQLAH